jgi:hypothetical protein
MLYSFLLWVFLKAFNEKQVWWMGRHYALFLYIFHTGFFSFNKARVHHSIHVRVVKNPIKIMLANIKCTFVGFTFLYNKYVPLMMNKKIRVFFHILSFVSCVSVATAVGSRLPQSIRIATPEYTTHSSLLASRWYDIRPFQSPSSAPPPSSSSPSRSHPRPPKNPDVVCPLLFW